MTRSNTVVVVAVVAGEPHRCRLPLATQRTRQEGSAALELAIVAPAILLVLLLIIGAGRTSSAHSQVQEAARDAARAASLQRSPAAADQAARTAAQTAFTETGLHCLNVNTAVDATLTVPEPAGRSMSPSPATSNCPTCHHYPCPAAAR